MWRFRATCSSTPHAMPVFNVSKSIVIEARLEKVFASVRNFKEWEAWSPWLRSEPGCPLKYAEDGKSYQWDGQIIGSGELAVVADEANKRIDYRLSFFRPWKSENTSAFHFAERNGATEVTWTMEGSLPFFLFFMKGMMSAWVGMDYDRGLKMLKDYLEIGSVPSEMEFLGTQPFEGFKYVGSSCECSIDDIGETVKETLRKVRQALVAAGHEVRNGFTIYHKFSMSKGVTSLTAGFLVENPPATPPAGLEVGEIPACSTYGIKHTGAYKHLGNPWAAGMMHSQCKPKQFQKDKSVPDFELYLNDPTEVGARNAETVVHLPAKG